MLRSRLCLSLLLAGLALPAGCSREEVLQRTFYPMGNVPFQVKAYDVPSGLFDETFEKIRQETQRLETILSRFVEDGDVVRLNRSGSETVSAELAQVLQVALKVAEQTDGAFDVTIGPVVDLWKRCAAEQRLPTDDELRRHLELVDWRQVAVNGDHKVTLRKQSMALDLGGVAKGAIADRAARLMKQQGIKRGIVDAGGDLVLFNSVGEEPFRVGIKHPERPDTVFAVLSIDNAAVVTSGCYERFESVAGRTICHILDPHTGQPVSGLASVTIVAEEGATADALATAVMVLGRERGQALVRSLPGVQAILIWNLGNGLEWWISPGLEGKVAVNE